MKPKLLANIVVPALLSTIGIQYTTAFAQSTAFSYQGQLLASGVPANGAYDLQFALFPTNQFGSPLAPILTNLDVPVINGLFTTTLDFGNGVFSGANFWIELGVRPSGSGAFTTLAPRQVVTPAPYSITAEGVNNLPGLRFVQNTNGAPNLIGGSPNNFISSGVVGATVGGGGAVIYNGAQYTNGVTASFGTVAGGADNFAGGYAATVSGGNQNTASKAFATVAGGQDNMASDADATVSGGENNVASINDATVGGGDDNTARGAYATVSGGLGNTASGFSAMVGGGSANTASGDDSMVPGGNDNTAGGDYSFAAGNRAHAGHNGAFVWADNNSSFTFSSTTANQFRVRSTGGAAFVTGIDGAGSVTSGVHVLSGDTAWSSISDQNAKKNFQPVNEEAVLDKLAAIPIEAWNYKWESDTHSPHIGPMAQDFKGAFYPGRDDKSISTLEFDGVELAAIQGLNRKLESQREELKQKETQITELNRRLEALEKIVLRENRHERNIDSSLK